MLDDKTIITVKNRDNGHIVYPIADLNNLRREFAPGEEKKITIEELKKLSWQPGGRALIEKFLLIDNEEAIAELLGNVEPEYYYTDKEGLE